MICPTGLKLSSPWKLEKDREGDARGQAAWKARQTVIYLEVTGIGTLDLPFQDCPMNSVGKQIPGEGPLAFHNLKSSSCLPNGGTVTYAISGTKP